MTRTDEVEIFHFFVCSVVLNLLPISIPQAYFNDLQFYKDIKYFQIQPYRRWSNNIDISTSKYRSSIFHPILNSKAFYTRNYIPKFPETNTKFIKYQILWFMLPQLFILGKECGKCFLNNWIFFFMIHKFFNIRFSVVIEIPSISFPLLLCAHGLGGRTISFYYPFPIKYNFYWYSYMKNNKFLVFCLRMGHFFRYRNEFFLKRSHFLSLAFHFHFHPPPQNRNEMEISFHFRVFETLRKNLINHDFQISSEYFQLTKV